MNKNGILVATLSLALLLTSTLHAEIYKWTDSNGTAHFTDRPPAHAQAEQLELKINTYSAVEVTPLVERLGRKNKVVMYSASWCGVCKKAKRYFKKKNIPYVVYDVEKSRIGKMDFKLLKGRSVPIIIVGRKRMNGFKVARFETLYEKEMQQHVTTVDIDPS